MTLTRRLENLEQRMAVAAGGEPTEAEFYESVMGLLLAGGIARQQGSQRIDYPEQALSGRLSGSGGASAHGSTSGVAELGK